MNYTPILSLNVDPNKMLSKYGAGICCGGDRRLFENSYMKIAGSEYFQKKYGENAFKYAERNHQLKTAVEKIDGIIKEVLND
jgi:iron-sulfur cluster repair protein YtfE (RIC family)